MPFSRKEVPFQSSAHPARFWFRRACLQVSIKHKNRLFKKSKSSYDLTEIEHYKTYRNLLTMLKQNSKQNYYATLAIRYGNDKSKIWRLINDLSNRKRNPKISVKSLINSAGEKLDNPDQVADCLNEHLCSVGERMSSDCPKSDKDPIEYISCDIKFPASFSPTSRHEVSKLIKSLWL